MFDAHSANPFRLSPLVAAVALMTTGLQAEPPVKIYVMVGQSNMQGYGGIEGEKPNTLRDVVRKDTEKQFQFLVDGNGDWVERSDVWIYLDQAPMAPRYSGLKPGYGARPDYIGPELGFGHRIGDATDGQVLIIKTCWGGKSLGNDFLPPSIGNYPTPTLPGEPGFYYHEILRIVNDVTENIGTLFPDYQGQGMEIAGLCYHQGWNDMGSEAYGGQLARFIEDIRSVEHGLGVPDLRVVVASSGMMRSDNPVKDGQLSMADTEKYPHFAGNVAVVDTSKPYGPEKLQFWFEAEDSPRDQGFHWNGNARTHLNIGFAMAAEMTRLDKPEPPSRFVAHGCDEGVQLNWQLGTEKPEGIELMRNGQGLGASLPPAVTSFTDTTALPGGNRYELVLDLPSGKKRLKASCDTSVQALKAYRSMAGVMLSWEARGKYEGFRISRDGKVIADGTAPESRSYEDKGAPARGKVSYAIQPTAGEVIPATLTVNRGPADAGGALIYEPFDYPADPDEPQGLVGKGGALGTKGVYSYLSDKNPERAAATIARGLDYGALPVTGNHGSTHRWSAPTAIELDGSLAKAGLLEDGATLWMSYVFRVDPNDGHRQGGGVVTLRTGDLKEGIGLKADGREYQTVVVMDGEEKPMRITSIRSLTSTLVVGKIVWGREGENDTFVPYTPGHDLGQPENHGRASVPFNIDQTGLNRLVLSGEGQFDEIRVGPTFESVTGGGGN